jgi:hypothetical protein
MAHNQRNSSAIEKAGLQLGNYPNVNVVVEIHNTETGYGVCFEVAPSLQGFGFPSLLKDRS